MLPLIQTLATAWLISAATLELDTQSIVWAVSSSLYLITSKGAN